MRLKEKVATKTKINYFSNLKIKIKKQLEINV